MKNWYYVCSFNLTSPLVKRYLEELRFIELGETVEVKLRSKLFQSYVMTVEMAEQDFNKKFEVLYVEEGDFKIQELVIVNPKFAVNPEVAEAAAENFGENTGTWDERCAAALYFLDDEYVRSEWLVKYEVYYAEDGIEYAHNGELERIMSNEDKFPPLYH